ncbi:cellulose biosynthesis protein BcsQ [Pusillimonas sp. NJUB218]|uniref:cellulose biosynthesis protein BcsQ n=1 Tax=Pusillimonas sp. NJUB218 TaxID=2023230 RepID=UPI000F4B0B96|nr:cellulose biosynthesis protein BcsQ [Pusillimonas sp. NJUB218]ROT45382.1 cellulose synthase operon protein YhjQ [Pusillimonas sp. NJUB218]
MENEDITTDHPLSPTYAIAIISAKGGVGKTSFAASLGVCMARADRPVIMLDLDPQNSLCHHVGIPPNAREGSALASLNNHKWSTTVVELAPDLRLIPYGIPSEAERTAYEDILEQNPHWLSERLSELSITPGTIIIFDTPPGPSIYIQRVLEIANLALVLTLPDAASFAAIPVMERLLNQYSRPRAAFDGAKYIINQVNSAHPLSRDMAEVIRHELGSALIGRIHADQFMCEALANRQDVTSFAPYSQASYDIKICTDRVLQLLQANTTKRP